MHPSWQRHCLWWRVSWLLFFGFCAGTRTVFAAYLVTFLIAFAFASPPQRRGQDLSSECLHKQESLYWEWTATRSRPRCRCTFRCCKIPVFITRTATFVDVCLKFVAEHVFGAQFAISPANNKETLEQHTVLAFVTY